MEQLNYFKKGFLRIFLFVTIALFGASPSIMAGVQPAKAPVNENWKFISAENDECPSYPFNLTADNGFTVNFATTGQIPECWTVYGETEEEEGKWIFDSQTNSFGGIVRDEMPDKFVVLSPIRLPASGENHIIFEAMNDMAEVAGSKASYEILVSSANDQIENFTSIGNYEVTASIPEYRSVTLPPAYNGETIYVAFRVYRPETESVSALSIHNLNVIHLDCSPVQVTGSNIISEQFIAAGILPACWKTVNRFWHIGELGQGAVSQISEYADPVNYIITSPLLMPADGGLRLSIDLSGYIEEDGEPVVSPEPFEIMISTTDNNIASFEMVLESQTNSVNPVTYFYNIPDEYNGKIIYIAVKHAKERGEEGYLRISNFQITACDNVPQFVEINAIEGNEIGLSWTDATSDSWIVEYAAYAWGEELEWTSVEVGGTPAVTLDGLEYNTDYRIRIQAVCEGGNYGRFSEILSARTEVACSLVPSNLRVDMLTENSITVSWDGTAEGNTWRVEYMENWGDPVVADVENRTYTITAVPRSNYEIKVQAVCQNGYGGEFTEPVTVQSLCEALELPVAMDFDEVWNMPPACWDIQSVSGSAKWVLGTSWNESLPYRAQSGYNYMYFSNGLNQGIARFVSPKMNLSGYEDAKISFWHIQAQDTDEGENYQDRLKVLYRNAPDGEWQLLAEYNDNTPVWTREDFVLPDLSDTYWIAFEGDFRYGKGIGVDDILINEGNCLTPYPTDITYTASNDGIELTWQGNEDMTGYEVGIRESKTGGEAEEWQDEMIGEGLSHTFTGLYSSTVYEVRIRQYCNEENPSDWYIMNVTTATPDATLPYLTGFENEYENRNWKLVNSEINIWNFGSGTFSEGDRALYITPDGWEEITPNIYFNDIPSTVWAYRDITFPEDAENDFILKFNWKSNGVNAGTTNGIMRVLVGEPEEVNAFQESFVAEPEILTPFGATVIENEPGIANFNGKSEWTSYRGTLNGPQNAAQTMRLYFVWTNGESTRTSNPPAAIDDLRIYADGEGIDLAVTQIENSSGITCAGSSAIAVSIAQLEDDPVSGFTVYYQIDQEEPVSRDITLSTPLQNGETYVHTFDAIDMAAGNYTVKAWVTHAIDLDQSNNEMTVSMTLKEMKEIPYREDFASVTLNEYSWMPVDANNDGASWSIENGTPTYRSSADSEGDDWLISPCIDMKAGIYGISYLSQNTGTDAASFMVYLGTEPTVEAMDMLVGTHNNIVNSEEALSTEHYITIDTDGIYYLGIKATSPAGRAVLTFDDLAVSTKYSVNINVHPFGNVEPRELVYVNTGEELTLKITPDADQHLLAVFAGNDMIRGEDTDHAGYLEINVGPYTGNTTIDVYFTNNSGEWVMVNGDQENKWYYGQVEGFENDKYYISDNNGTTNRYDIRTPSIVHLYRDVTVQQPGNRITFDYRANGEANDNLRFAVTGIADYPEAGTILSGVPAEEFYGSNEWRQYTTDITQAGIYRLVLTWINDGANGAQYPAAMDNFEMTPLCAAPSDLDVIVNTGNGVNDVTAIVSWMAGEGQSAWQVEYKTVSNDEWFSVNVNDQPRITLSNLLTDLDYDIRVKAICIDGNESRYITATFEVPCINIDEETSLCLDEILCEAPVVRVIEVTSGGAELSWDAEQGENTWNVEFRESNGPTWNSLITADNEVTIPGLTSETDYEVRVKKICADNLQSEYSGTISFTTLTSCEMPRDITYSNYTDRTTVSWADEAHDQWIVAIRKDGTDDNAWTEIPVSNTPAVTFSLDNNTIYHVRVKAVCGIDDESGWATTDITTGCAPFTVPFIESFNNNRLPDCWTNVDNKWTFAASGANSTVTTTADYLLTPAISIPEEGSYYVAFNASGAFEGVENLKLMISTTGTRIDRFVPFYTTGIAGSHVQSFETSIPEEYNGQIVNIAFVHDVPTTGGRITISNVIITGCPVPSTLTQEEVGMDYVTVSWTSEPIVGSWILEYSSDQQNWTSIPVDQNNYTIENLNAQTTYYIRIKSVCAGNNESLYSDVLSVSTLCGVITELPFTEDFEGLSTSNFPRDCWSLSKVGANWASTDLRNHTPDGERSAYHHDTRGVQNAWLILPKIRISDEEVKLYFWSSNYGVASYGKNSIFISTGSNDPSTGDFIEVWSPESVTDPWTEIAIDLGQYIDQDIYIAFNYQGNNSHRWFIDDIYVGIKENCNPVSFLYADGIGLDTAHVIWTTNGNAQQWEFQYREGNGIWSNSEVVDVEYFTLRNLTPATRYEIRVRPVCTNLEGETPEWVTTGFITETTFRIVAETPYITGFESDEDNLNWHIANVGRNDWYFGRATSNGGEKSLYISNDQGQSNAYSVSNQSNVWAYRDVYFAPSTKDYTLSFDWKANAEDNFDFMKVFIGDTSVNMVGSVGAFEIPGPAKALINPLKGTEFFSSQTGWVHFSTTLDATLFSDTTVRIYFGWRNDGSMGNQPPAAIDNFSIVGDVAVDLAIEAGTINVACGSDIPVSVGITQLGEDNITAFTVNYQYKNIIETEVVTLSEPLTTGGVYYYTFPTMITLDEDENLLRVWVEYDGESQSLLYNNSREVAVNILPAVEIPYQEDFNEPFSATAWSITDANHDGVTWQQEDGRIIYTYSDIDQANDWLISRCIHIPAGTYEIGYTYNALSLLPESFTVNLSANHDFSGTPQVIAQHLNFNQQANDVAFKETFTVAQDGIYYIGIHAISNAGNAGITFDDFYINPVLQVQVNYGNNGTVQPAGNIDVTYGESVTLLITPDEGYHLGSITVNGRIVRGEDMAYAEYIPYTYGPVTDDAVIDIAFAGDTYTIRSFISNYENIGINGSHAIGGTITPSGANNYNYGTSPVYTITLHDHFHLYDVVVDTASVMDQVVMVDAQTYTYTFNGLDAHHTIRAIVRIDTVMLTYNITGGIATLNGEPVDATEAAVVKEFYVNYGYDHTMNLTPSTGYFIRDIVTEGISLGPVRQFVFRNVTEPGEVDIYLDTEGFTINTVAHGHGTVTEGTAIVYNPDYRFGYEVIADEGYHISTLTINGVSQPASGLSYYTDTLRDIIQDYNIEAYFAINTYTIEATAGSNGRVVPSGTVTYNWNTSRTYAASADAGYYISEIILDEDTTYYNAGDNLISWTHTFTAINSDHIIRIRFEQYTYNITATAGANGAIAPDGITQVPYNGSQSYTIQPAEGYVIAAITVDGQEVGNMANYNFTNVTSDHTISATFARSRYQITATAGTGGSVTPSGTQSYEYGDSQVYTAAPDAGYMISTVTLDGIVHNIYGSAWSHTFSDINEDHTIFVNFTRNTYMITVTQPANGYITPGSQAVYQNATPTYYITPSTGYEVENVTVDGNTVTFTVDEMGNASYTFPAVTANKTITASMKLRTYTITSTSGANGTITPAGTTTVNYGTAQVYTITPADGYEIADVKVDNISVGHVSSYQFPYVTASHSIHAEFVLSTCETPARLYTTDITYNSAILHWSANAGTYTIRYKTREETNYTEISNVTGNQYMLSGLTPNTFYVWRIQADCGYNSSEWSDQSVFSTRVDPSIGIGENSLANVKVYSNLDNIYIVNENNLNIKQVEIYDIFGRSVYQNAMSNQSKEMIRLPVASGTYVVRLLTADGIGTYKVNILK